MRKNNLLKTLAWQKDLGADEIIVADPKIFDEKMKKSKKSKADKAEAIKPATTKAAVSAVIPVDMPDLAAIESLEGLRAAVEKYDGCLLKKTAANTVFADGNPKAKIMVIGEAPGADEDRLGKPFVGRSGQLLDQIFASIGLNRDTIYISNIVLWRPPNNRPPSDAEISQCLPFIEKHIALVNPEIILLAGGTATKALLKTNQGIMKLRGRYTEYTNPYLSRSIKALPTFHPAYLLRSPGQKKLVWQDFLMLKKSLAA